MQNSAQKQDRFIVVAFLVCFAYFLIIMLMDRVFV